MVLSPYTLRSIFCLFLLVNLSFFSHNSLAGRTKKATVKTQQIIKTKKIKGFVTNNKGKPIVGAQILRTENLEIIKTDSNGYFEFLTNFRKEKILVGHPNFKSISLTSDSKLKIKLSLKPINEKKSSDLPLLIINDKKIGRLFKIDHIIKPEEIADLYFIKPDIAFDQYGKEGKNGIIKIITNQYVDTKKKKEKMPIFISNELQDSQMTEYQQLEIPPYFPGGLSAFRKWISSNLDYPVLALHNLNQGVVVVKFTIDKEGNVKMVNVDRSIDPILDKEAIRVITSMPKWKPGIKNGKPTDVKFMVPISFEINIKKL